METQIASRSGLLVPRENMKEEPKPHPLMDRVMAHEHLLLSSQIADMALELLLEEVSETLWKRIYEICFGSFKTVAARSYLWNYNFSYCQLALEAFYTNYGRILTEEELDTLLTLCTQYPDELLTREMFFSDRLLL